MTMNSKLKSLFLSHQDKVFDKWSSYLTVYDRLFSDYRDKQICLFEIGVQNGGSLEVWSKYFNNSSVLIGCDINAECANLNYDDPRIKVIIGDANSLDVSERVSELASQLDIIIDDGSHRSSDIIKSFALYFPRLAEGGLYVVEDLHCSYWVDYEGGLFYPCSSISFFKNLIDIINYEHWGIAEERSYVLREIFMQYGCEINVEVLSHIHSIEFVNSLCVVRKKSPASNVLGRRIVGGSVASITTDILMESGNLLTAPDQSYNPWTTKRPPLNKCLDIHEIRETSNEITIYFAFDVIQPYSENRAVTHRYPQSEDCTRVDLIFPSDLQPLARLRLDITNAPAAIILHTASLNFPDGTEIWRWDGGCSLFVNQVDMFCLPDDGGVLILSLSNDPRCELNLSPDVLSKIQGGCYLRLELTARPLLEVLPDVLSSLQAKSETALPASIRPHWPATAAGQLAELGELLKTVVERKNATIESQRAEIQALQDRQNALYEQLVRAEAQLDLLKQLVLPEAGSRLERL
jgi:hypothetical protein